MSQEKNEEMLELDQMLAQMAQEHVLHTIVIVPLQQFAASHIRLVTARRQDALLQIRRVRTVQQQLLIVVRLDDNVVGGAQILFHLGVRLAAVGSNHEPLVHKVYHVPYTLCRVV